MTKQTITALFDDREYAKNAVLKLQQMGLSEVDVTLSPESAASGYSETVDQPTKGFWASLEDMFGSTEDHYTYAEGLRRGGTLLTAHVDDAKVDQAIEILEEHGSVDMNERETTWRGEGWTGAPVTGGGVASQGAGPLRSVAPVEDEVMSTASTVSREKTDAAATMALSSAKSAGSQKVAGEDVLQVVEESLDVGKRAVNRGKVRLHSYVVEKAVSEDVMLRDETISIDRRPVDRPAAVADLGIDAFKDRTIEMTQMGEEAVVAKSARVVEEIGIRKDATDRVQTISDTVRSTKVEVEDSRTVASSAALMGDFATRLTNDMDVVGSDGQHVGTIDHVDGAMIKLKKMDSAAGGQHHLIPTDWIKSVDGKVMLKTPATDVMSRWTAA